MTERRGRRSDLLEEHQARPRARSRLFARAIRIYWFDVVLWKRILLGMALGVAAGLLLGETAVHIKWVGDLFIRLIRMLVVPLVFATIVAGVVSISDVRRLGAIGAKTLLLYLCTTLVGASLGLCLGTLFRPGAGVVFAAVDKPTEVGAATSLQDQFLSIVPLNPVAALAGGDILSVIFFAIMFGIAMLLAGERARPLADLFSGVTEVMQRLTTIVMEAAPFGVFALIAWVTGTSGAEVFVHVFLLAFCVMLGCTLQVLIVHGGLIRLAAGLPAVPFFRDIADAVVVAFSTSSSAASLPVVMRVAEENLGVGRAVSSTALPIGVTVSMDGTAMYVGLLSMFAAQAFGLDVSPLHYALLLLAIVVIAVGSAPIPSAALFLLAGVLQVLGLSAEQTALVVGFILPFDRVLDMMRTIPNCTSDLSVAVTVARWEGELDEAVYRAKPTS